MFPSFPPPSRPIAGLLVIALVHIGSESAFAQVRLPTAPAAPTPVTAYPGVPTEIVLTWPAVSGANGYRVTFTDNKWIPDSTLYEGRSSTFAVDATMCANGMPCTYVHRRAVLPFVYSYRVYAIFYSTIGPLLSGPSQVVSTQSAPYQAPTNFTYTVAVSRKLGLLALTVKWNPVTNASQYSATINNGKGYWTTQTVAGPSVVFDPVRMKDPYTVCVYSIYRSSNTGATIADPKVTGCIPLTL